MPVKIANRNFPTKIGIAEGADVRSYVTELP